MQFSENAQNNYFFSQPHQPFFVLALINAIITMSLFMLAYNGSIHLSISASGFHAYGLTYLMLTPAFLAFLFTTFPRFTSTAPIEKILYMRVFSLYYMGSIVFLLGSIVSPVFSGLGMMVVFIAHLMGIYILKKIYTSTNIEDKHDIYWILLAMWMGLFSHTIFLISAFFYKPLMGLSTEISAYLYLFLLTFTVAQRMVPFFSHCVVEKNKKLLKVIFVLLVLHIILEGIVTNSSFIVDFALAYFIGKELLEWKLPFPNPNPLLWILHLALFWVPVGFIIGGLTNLITLIFGIYFLALDTHVLMLGFIVTMLIGFGTRVTIGHSGNTMHADRWTTRLFYGTQVVVIMRVLVSFVAAFGWDFILIFNISVGVWILLFAFWALRFFAVLIEGKKLN